MTLVDAYVDAGWVHGWVREGLVPWAVTCAALLSGSWIARCEHRDERGPACCPCNDRRSSCVYCEINVRFLRIPCVGLALSNAGPKAPVPPQSSTCFTKRYDCYIEVTRAFAWCDSERHRPTCCVKPAVTLYARCVAEGVTR